MSLVTIQDVRRVCLSFLQNMKRLNEAIKPEAHSCHITGCETKPSSVLDVRRVPRPSGAIKLEACPWSQYRMWGVSLNLAGRETCLCPSKRNAKTWGMSLVTVQNVRRVFHSCRTWDGPRPNGTTRPETCSYLQYKIWGVFLILAKYKCVSMF